jgi:hypothetical protein
MTPEVSDMDKKSKPAINISLLGAFLATVFLLVGVIFVLLSILSVKNHLYQTFFLTFGGALIGTGLGTLASEISNRYSYKNIADEVVKIQHNSIQIPWMKNDDVTIESVRKKFHIYYRSRENAHEYWNHYIIDFTKYKSPYDSVEFESRFVNERRKYIAFAFRTGNCLEIVIFRKNNMETPQTILMFHDYGNGNNDAFGINRHIDYDGNNTIDPCIISSSNNYNIEVGPVKNEYSSLLYDRWKANMKIDL